MAAAAINQVWWVEKAGDSLGLSWFSGNWNSNLRRLALTTLQLPPDVDLPTFLLSDFERNSMNFILKTGQLSAVAG